MVAWLEYLAGEALDAEEEAVLRAGGSAGRFAQDEGLWKETRTRLAAGVPQKPGALCVLSSGCKGRAEQSLRFAQLTCTFSWLEEPSEQRRHVQNCHYASAHSWAPDELAAEIGMVRTQCFEHC